MIKSEYFDFASYDSLIAKGFERSAESLNEVFVLIDLGGAVWFFLSVSDLRVFDAGCISPGSVSSGRMGHHRAGNHRLSDQYQHSAYMFTVDV